MGHARCPTHYNVFMHDDLLDWKTNVAVELLTEVNMFAATQEYIPKSISVTFTRSNSSTTIPLDWLLLVLARVLVWPSAFVNVHEIVGGGIPVAEQLKVAKLSCSSSMLCGACKITGSTAKDHNLLNTSSNIINYNYITCNIVKVCLFRHRILYIIQYGWHLLNQWQKQ